jgi:gluconate 2-dehydrogenase gamma chain
MTRRYFLGKTAVMAGAIQVVSSPIFSAAAGRSAGPATDYRSLNKDEAAFTEALVNVLCPADHLTPNGRECGLARFLDRQLSSDEGGKKEVHLSPLPLTRERFFKAGIAAANVACQDRFAVRFHQLNARYASRFLQDIAGGRVSDPVFPLTAWLNQFVDPLLIQGSFTGPIYEGFNYRVFWKLTGHTVAA